MADNFNLAEWLTAAGALCAAAVAALGVRWQWESMEPVLEASCSWLKNGLLRVNVSVSRQENKTTIIHKARLLKPKGKIGLNTPYVGAQTGLRFDLPFRTNEITLWLEVNSRRSVDGEIPYWFDLFLQPDSSEIRTFSIAFLVSIKSRPTRRRWITVSSVVPAIITPQTPIMSA